MIDRAPQAEETVRILLIDDDRDDYYLTRQVLEEIPHFRFDLSWEWEYGAGVREAVRCAYDICLVDYRLGVKSGLDLLREIRAANCKVPVILLTGQIGPEIDIAAMKAGAADFLEKSKLEPTILDRAIRYARQQRMNESELEAKVVARTEELAAANAALKQADQRKDEFLATLAHELRNPLAPIRNALEIIRLAADDPSTVERARQMMERQTHQLVRLIDDLLDVSRINRDKLTLQCEVLPIREIIESALEATRPLIEKSQLKLKVDIPPEPIRVRADRVRMAQIFSNLLNNSAKYTPPGGTVILKVRQESAQVVVCIQDTGVGIPTEMLPAIFELFTQVDRSLNRSQGGLGIGLSLVKKLVEMHGGTVEAHSEGIDRGTTMLVSLPIAA